MALEEQIVNWAKDRPNWQREVLCRVAAGEVFSDSDYDQLVKKLISGDDGQTASFDLSDFPGTSGSEESVTLESIQKILHVNALASDETLTFQPDGFTIVYGDNGSGKSGYARILKRIARSRHREDVLSDVFRDTAVEKPTAKLVIRVGGKKSAIDWPDGSSANLQRMQFYDSLCGQAYSESESDFPYRPSALVVMDALIEVCTEVRQRLDAKLKEAHVSRASLPTVLEDVSDTGAGKFISNISAESHREDIKRLVDEFDNSAESIEGLKKQEIDLKNSDTTAAKAKYLRDVQKLKQLERHIMTLSSVANDEAVDLLNDLTNTLGELESASKVLASQFESEPLNGVGSSPWKQLWHSAREFSRQSAYVDKPFPNTVESSLCVLCMRELNDQSKERLRRFEEFVKDDTEKRLAEIKQTREQKCIAQRKVEVESENVGNLLTDLETTDAELAGEIRVYLKLFADSHGAVIDALDARHEIPKAYPMCEVPLEKLKNAVSSLEGRAANLGDANSLRLELSKVEKRRKELELLKAIKDKRAEIESEIVRWQAIAKLERAKSAAATGSISRKLAELSEENITEVVRNRFTRETERMKLDNITLSRGKAPKGAVHHLPKLVGARQDIAVRRVFSEGERTALGLAALFTEVKLDDSKSALILDDPVTSLDHVRRSQVAYRLAELAEDRQVIVFTHDVSFVADLKQAAAALDVGLAERTVSKARGAEKQPGACSNTHPWKAKDAAQRFHYLENELARLKKLSDSYDENEYEKEVAIWAGNASETWERIISQEIVDPVFAEGGIEVRPKMVKAIARFTQDDHREFDASYGRISQWAKRHDKSSVTNYVAPDLDALQTEFDLMQGWFNRIKKYKN